MLETLVQSSTDMGLSELARAARTDKSSAFRLLGGLVAAGYVIQETETKKYRPTSKLVVLGSTVLSRIDLRQAVRSCLARLVDRTGYTALLAALVDGGWREIIYLDQAVPSTAAVSVNIRVGRVAPSHCTSAGKAILAFLPEDQRTQIEGDLPSYTPRTLVSGAALRLHLEAVRALGYAVDDEEYREGLRCVSAPVRNHLGLVVGSLTLSAPAASLPLDEVHGLGRVVMEEADVASRDMGWSPGLRIPSSVSHALAI